MVWVLENLTVPELVKRIPSISCKLNIYFHTHNNSPPFPILVTQLKLTSTRPICLRHILISFPYVSPGFPNGSFLSGFPTEAMLELFCSSLRDICPTHLFLLTTHVTFRCVHNELFQSSKSPTPVIYVKSALLLSSIKQHISELTGLR